VSVNVSVHQLREPGYAAEVARVVEQTGLPAGAVILEVTESVLITDEDQTVETLHDLAGLGFAIALDDFGTGYSSLSYLQRFPVDMLKIDRSFVSGGFGEKRDQLVRDRGRGTAAPARPGRLPAGAGLPPGPSRRAGRRLRASRARCGPSRPQPLSRVLRSTRAGSRRRTEG
jgi:hypothetical protein